MDYADLGVRRLSRRRVLTAVGAGGTGLLGAALIGCSASGKTSPTSPGAPQQATVAAVSEKPKSGGILKYPVTEDPDTLDPYRSAGSTAYYIAANVNSRLFSMEPGVGAAATGKVVGDLVKTWEQPDPLTLLVHLDPAAKFDKREPLNGRAVTANDVVQSWVRFAKESLYRVNLSNAANKTAPVTSVEAVDDKTVRFKLAFPDATLLPQLGWYFFWVQPSEGIAGKFDLAKEPRGSGPFLFDSHNRSVGLKFKRNPDWHGGPEKPYVDGINVTVLPDIAQQEVQFRSKNLHFNAVSPGNIPQFAKELKDTAIVVVGPPTPSPAMGLSYLPGQPWNDVRVRRAVSMALDRETWANVSYPQKEYEALGVKLKFYFNTPLAGGYGAYWLDPKGSEFGPAAEYLKFNTAEAVKLLAAAGYGPSKPLEFDHVWASRYGIDVQSKVEIYQSMLAKAGVKMNSVSVDYVTEFIPKYFRAQAEHKGKNVEASTVYSPGGTSPDAVIWYQQYMSKGGASSQIGKYFPAVDDALAKIKGMLEFNDRVAAMKDLQRYTVDNMITIPAGPAPETTDLVWKALSGPQQYRAWMGTATSSTTLVLPSYWFREQI